jgi:hypothetical protein
VKQTHAVPLVAVSFAFGADYIFQGLHNHWGSSKV